MTEGVETPADFDAVWSRAEPVEGWLTREQAEMLFRAARSCPRGGRVVEIGSFRGRSTIVLASAASAGVEVIAIDPHAGNDRGPEEIHGYASQAEADHEAFHAHLHRAGVASRVTHRREFSAAALGTVPGEVDVVFVDGAHRFAPAREDLLGWGARVPRGGTMLVHDAFSSLGVTFALWSAVIGRGRWRYRGRAGSLVRYDADRDRGPVAVAIEVLRAVALMPWFAKNLALKVVLRLGGARWWTRRGKDVPPWPY